MMLKIYNSLSKKTEEFMPIHGNDVGMYACGPTVYDYPHIGHGRKYVNDDILKRVLEVVEGYKVTHVQNITDVGHLVSDADEGEDKLEKGAKKTGKTVWEVAQEYTDYFLKEMDSLNIIRPDIECKATDHIPEQIELIKKIMENGYGYDTPEAVYFDVTKFADYGQLFGQSLEEKLIGGRDEVVTENSKKNPADFALWFKKVGKFADHVMHWESPWGDGFPGWHVECSAMSMKYLGEQFDIHTGGEDHLSIHHPNEIAQSEAITGKKPFVKYWFHSLFLAVDGKKMSKSLGNVYKVADIIEKGFSPMALRYYYLSAHYRKQMNFSWEGMEGVSNSYKKLKKEFLALRVEGGQDKNIFGNNAEVQLSGREAFFRDEFINAVEDDLNMSAALAVARAVLKDEKLNSFEKRRLVENFDKVFGLKLSERDEIPVDIPAEVMDMVNKREEMRKAKKWAESDALRKGIEAKGFKVSDFFDGVTVEKI
ncbi:TPA: cysteine--tRNA ligase [Candidatus Collierbacteria bacterium]|nr:cysteine--tRNA ligase [Candidatus Collierbacteria bacterium]